jgi:hypothetical protein
VADLALRMWAAALGSQVFTGRPDSGPQVSGSTLESWLWSRDRQAPCSWARGLTVLGLSVLENVHTH